MVRQKRLMLSSDTVTRVCFDNDCRYHEFRTQDIVAGNDWITGFATYSVKRKP